ncbi:MAG: hypothetical protein U0132_17290 [Gemmatimonadaceae bacterium]
MTDLLGMDLLWLAVVGTLASLTTALYSAFRLQRRLRAERAIVRELVYRMQHDRQWMKRMANHESSVRLTGEHLLLESYRDLVESSLRVLAPGEKRWLEDALHRNGSRAQLNYLQKLFEEARSQIEGPEARVTATVRS